MREMALFTGVIVFAIINGAGLIALVIRDRTDAAQSVPVSSGEAVALGAGGPGQAIFQQQCVACHTIGGGPGVGPDLEGVTERRERAWLTRWIAEPDKVLAEGDPIATGLLQEFNNVQMVNLGLSAAQVEDVLAFLENPGGVVTASPAAAELLEGDPDRGEAFSRAALDCRMARRPV
jgi:mono/diheme cytochrome c family protein